MKTEPSYDDRQTRIIHSFVAGCLALALVILVALLVHDATDDPDSGPSTGRCAPAMAGTVDPVTCLPYGQPGGAAAPATNNSGSSAQTPKAPAKAPTAPKPAAPAPKAPAAPVKVPAPARR
ncbi:hypothetical protein [Streptomyces sp. CL12-4]|uniref:hypothetical protein n=1 Tax=Streptomyces sp. CL12-4 TaxID=2810306 RepID=UPI001EFAF4E6|nr:hypothetical protein [Streptomyces sp. CL12-4]MCG8971816.1 hypothetical protein [Streptomyces sp. CL12-4]